VLRTTGSGRFRTITSSRMSLCLEQHESVTTDPSQSFGSGGFGEVRLRAEASRAYARQRPRTGSRGTDAVSNIPITIATSRHKQRPSNSR